jgi:SpoVK/Ycf46/Vps4 family AAA+-type ATPase
MDAVSRIPENCFLVLEDFDNIFGTDKNKVNITLSSFLNCLDGLQSKTEQVVFLTTNNYITIDPVICRPGRIDVVIEFKEIIKQQLMTMLTKFFPSQHEKYETFYEKIKDKRLTTCMLQQYLFPRYPNGCILENIEKTFNDMLNVHRFGANGKKEWLYT